MNAKLMFLLVLLLSSSFLNAEGTDAQIVDIEYRVVFFQGGNQQAQEVCRSEGHVVISQNGSIEDAYHARHQSQFSDKSLDVDVSAFAYEVLDNKQNSDGSLELRLEFAVISNGTKSPTRVSTTIKSDTIYDVDEVRTVRHYLPSCIIQDSSPGVYSINNEAEVNCVEPEHAGTYLFFIRARN